MRTIPNMQIFCPADEADMVLGLQDLLINPAPCYVRFNASPCRTRHHPFQIGEAETLSVGGDVTILVYGMLLRQALEARDRMEAQGISTGVMNLRMLKPVDEERILEAAQRTSLLVTLEDHFLTGGLFSILAELLLKRQQPCNVLPIALKDRWFKPGRLEDVLHHEGFTGEQIAEKIISTLPRRKTHAQRSPVQSILS
jgi:transketolase